MTTSSNDATVNPPPTPDPAKHPDTHGPRVTTWLLRIVALAHLLSLAIQPVLAGYYLSGDFDALQAHAANGGLVHLSALAQIVAAIIYVWLGRGRWWPLLFGCGLFFADVIQLGSGYARERGVHFPLGVLLILAQLLFVCWIFRRSAALTRRRRRTRER